MAGWNDGIIQEFRENDGRVGGYFEGATVLLLHSTGRRSGDERVNPLVYLPDGDRWVVFGSKGGHPFDPHWVLNLESNPDATIEVGTETIPVRATVVRDEPERSELYARQVARRDGFAEYEEKLDGVRVIPVVVLERRAG
jgi:deazaflavin-dependent oxidoreductase (nitroreductase family)